MLARNHILFAIPTAAAFIIEVILPLGYSLFCVPIILLFATYGALACDIDETKSSIGRRYFFISFVLKHILRFSHRGITHSLLFVVVLLAPAFLSSYLDTYLNSYLIENYGVSSFLASIYTLIHQYLAQAFEAMFVGLSIGALSHILTDMLSNHGVCLFAPISFDRKQFLPHILSISTGSFVEKTLVTAIGFLLSIASLYYLYTGIVAHV